MALVQHGHSAATLAATALGRVVPAALVRHMGEHKHTHKQTLAMAHTLCLRRPTPDTFLERHTCLVGECGMLTAWRPPPAAVYTSNIGVCICCQNSSVRVLYDGAAIINWPLEAHSVHIDNACTRIGNHAGGEATNYLPTGVQPPACSKTGICRCVSRL